MDKFGKFVTRHRKSIMVVFIIATIISAVLAMSVKVNYNMEDYLPADSNSSRGLEIMKTEFDQELSYADVAVFDVSISEALEYKEKLLQIEHVTSVMWLDDIIGLDNLKTIPVDFLGSEMIEPYYNKDSALFTVFIEPGYEVPAIDNIRALIGEDNAIAGSSSEKAAMQKLAGSETLKSIAILLPIILVILLITTSSWVEPIIYLIAIGVAIIINMGTNLIFKDISFLTNTVSPILQLAVSLDYAIFLMHSYKYFLEEKQNTPERAMQLAIKKSITSIFGSASTTIIGFAALIFMRFGIGRDLGINLVKGVTLSFLSVIVFMPALVLSATKLMEKTKHKALKMDSKRTGKWILKLRIPLLILSLLVILPSFLAKSNITFEYGTSNMASHSKAEIDSERINETFGENNQIIVLIPNHDTGKEVVLTEKLANIKHVDAVISYDSMIGSMIPESFVPKTAKDMFRSGNYSRIILATKLEQESELTFAVLDEIHETASEDYDEYYVVGHSASVHDIKTVVVSDNTIITIVSILGIFLVLLLIFKSISIPLILVFTIEAAIWINLGIVYFQGNPLNYIGFMVINTVQLGATIDYAILMTDRYKAYRNKHVAKPAMEKTVASGIPAILVSAFILSSAGFMLALTSSNPIISELGILLGRGTILSFVLVTTALPALLILFDWVVRKTTYKSGFYTEPKIKRLKDKTLTDKKQIDNKSGDKI